MKLDPKNDVYQGDLATLNTRKHAWAAGEHSADKFKIASWVIVAIGFAVIIYIYFQVREGTTTLSQLPMHLAIWITALLAIFVNKRGKKISEQPFAGYHMARFEVDDDTVYYVYQQGMALCTYFIHDKDIRRIYRDDEAGVLLFEGDATLNIHKRSSETNEPVREFYTLVPFDKYDLDDLLKPYRRKVTKADGKLRERYSAEHIS